MSLPSRKMKKNIQDINNNNNNDNNNIDNNINNMDNRAVVPPNRVIPDSEGQGLPRRRGRQYTNQNPNNMQSQNLARNINNVGPAFEGVKDFDSLRALQIFKIRHDTRGAISIRNLEDEDVVDNADFYNNKDINYEQMKIKEKITKDNTETYIESIHHDKFFKIETKEKTEDILEKDQKEEIKTPGGEDTRLKKHKRKKPLTAYQKNYLNEIREFREFDKSLSDALNKTFKIVSLIFLVAQGILAGIGVLHFFVILSYDDFSQFIKSFSKIVMKKYIMIQTLTLASLVGNGIKFLINLQNYNKIKNKMGKMEEFLKRKKHMLLSGILLGFFIVTFAIEIYICTHIQHINLEKCKESSYKTPYTENEFNKFKTAHIIVNILVIILFLFNIFEVNLDNEENNEKNDDYYLDEEALIK